MSDIVQLTDQILKYQDLPIRIVIKNSRTWFCNKDICAILDIRNHNDAYRSLDEDEKDGIDATDPIGRTQETGFVSESGLYALIFKSRKAEAKTFRKWVTSDVLPSLRKTGQFTVDERTKLLKDINNLEDEKKHLKLDLIQEQKKSIKLGKTILTVAKKNNHRHKLLKLRCSYLLKDPDHKTEKYKLGRTEDINQRLKSYRTTCPNIKICYLVYTSDDDKLEELIKYKFRNELEESAHEWIIAPLATIIKAFKDIEKIFKHDVKVDHELWKYNLEDPPEEKIDEQCTPCSLQPINTINIKTQEIAINPETNKYKCSECDKEYARKDSLRRHIWNEHTDGKKHDCLICNKTFARQDGLKRHIKEIHNKDESTVFNCDLCSKTFPRKNALIRHIKEIHNKDEATVFNCDLCSKTFSRKNALVRHIKTVHNNCRYQCNLCDKCYTSKGNLDDHIHSIHSRIP